MVEDEESQKRRLRKREREGERKRHQRKRSAHSDFVAAARRNNSPSQSTCSTKADEKDGDRATDANESSCTFLFFFF